MTTAIIICLALLNLWLVILCRVWSVKYEKLLQEHAELLQRKEFSTVTRPGITNMPYSIAELKATDDGEVWARLKFESDAPGANTQPKDQP